MCLKYGLLIHVNVTEAAGTPCDGRDEGVKSDPQPTAEASLTIWNGMDWTRLE